VATTREIVTALGGRRAVGVRVADAEGLHERIRAGLPYASLEHVAGILGISLDEVGDVLDIPRRTRARRKESRRLTAVESDRLVRLARAAAQAAGVLGSRQKAASWLARPNRALGGKVPLHLLETEVGERLVEEVLGRIEYGVIG